MKLWENTPGLAEETPAITPYLPTHKKSRAAVVIFPGGGYALRAPYEGKDYAEFLSKNGISAFVVDYRVAPHRFPLPLLDARRAVRFVRAHAKEYGLDRDKIAVMGSSAGGHLAALVSTYHERIEFEGIDAIDSENPIPNAQILCYPVICAPTTDSDIAHARSYHNLLGEERTAREAERFAPDRLADENTPPAFIWHTANDATVNVINSYRYAAALREHSVSSEMHVFPDGRHGLGLAADYPHVAQWKPLLLNWFSYHGWL